MAGYHRIGFGAGLGVSYALSPRLALHTELVYRNVGSKDSYFSDFKRSIDIQQAQIPFYLSYRTWWDNGLSKFHFDAGMLYARNLQTEINFPRFEKQTPWLKSDDIGMMAGFGVWLRLHHGIQSRYIRSFNPILKNPEENLTWKLYYISLQYLYRF